MNNLQLTSVSVILVVFQSFETKQRIWIPIFWFESTAQLLRVLNCPLTSYEDNLGIALLSTNCKSSKQNYGSYIKNHWQKTNPNNTKFKIYDLIFMSFFGPIQTASHLITIKLLRTLLRKKLQHKVQWALLVTVLLTSWCQLDMGSHGKLW